MQSPNLVYMGKRAHKAGLCVLLLFVRKAGGLLVRCWCKRSSYKEAVHNLCWLLVYGNYSKWYIEHLNPVS